MSNTSTTSETTLVCANCGKEGSEATNTCNKCKSVMYCNAACKKKHRKKHKKECEKRVAELHDETLFKQPPSLHGDCPICFLRIPTLESGRRYYTCCGKTICSGCICAPVYDDKGNMVDDDKQNQCPFCRIVAPKTAEEAIKMVKKRAEAGDAVAICNIGSKYYNGSHGFPQDRDKALELYQQAGELDCAAAYAEIGHLFLKVDKKKEARHYYELAAMSGSTESRHNLGVFEENRGHFDRAIKHYTIAARGGKKDSLASIQKYYSLGHATKDDYSKALESYQAYLDEDEIKSDQRDKAAAADEDYKYY